MRNLVPMGVGLLALAGLALQTSDALATETCAGVSIIDKLVMIPVVASDSPSDTILSRQELMDQAQWLRDWFKANSNGCFVPDIWIDSEQPLGQTLAQVCPNGRCNVGTLKTLAEQVKTSRMPIYGDDTAVQYIKIVMGGTTVSDTSLIMGTSSRLRLDRATLVHELGHTLLGLNDAGEMDCGTGPFGPDPRDQDFDWRMCGLEQGSVVSPMASVNTMHYSAPEKYHLGFLGTTLPVFYDQKSTTQTQNVRLYDSSLPAASGRRQLIRIKLTNTTNNVPPYYWIEYRRGKNEPIMPPSRVHVYWQPRISPAASGDLSALKKRYWFVGSEQGTADAVTKEPFEDPVTGITVTPTARTDEFVDLTIRIPGN